MTPLFRLLLGVASFVLAASPAVAASPTAVEYYYGGYGHYFVTASPPEIAALDGGRFRRWVRTGQSFGVFDLNAAGAANVCRFWSGQTFAPKASHFYTSYAAECAYLKRQGVWQYEGDVFALGLPAGPAGQGTCAPGTQPLYRAYNNGQTGAPNHRYTTDPAVLDAMLAQGWVMEGEVTTRVFACVPARPASVTVDSPTSSPWVGESVLVTAVARDASGAVIPGTTATWSSSNLAVATISTTGVLQALATGTVMVTATIDGVAGTQSLNITPMPKIGVTVGTTREVVFAYTRDHCSDSDLDFPDLPTHVVRAEDGSLVLFASAAPRFYVSRGADFASFKRDCSQPVLVSPDLPTPQSYENREWISAVYREGNRWHALISNEFHDLVASTCRSSDPSTYIDCTYLSATYAVSTDGARTFTKPSPPAHVVLPPPYVWEPPLPGALPNGEWGFHEGYNAPFSLVRKDDGFFYAIVGLTPSKSIPYAGQCLLRTNRLDDPASWRAWDGAGFNDRITSPYVTGSPAPLCKASYDLPGGLLTFNTYLNRYMNLDTYQIAVDGKLFCSFSFRLSADLLHWGAEQLITEMGDAGFCPFDPQRPGFLLEPVNAMYPTSIDHADTTINFERPGRTPYLYYVRFNDYWKNRDLVRVTLTFTRLD